MTTETLSSGSTFFMKRVFPVIWLGFLAVFVLMALLSGGFQDAVPLIILPIIMAAFGILMFRKLVWDLADEVLLSGDGLIIRKSGQEERIRLADIMNVSVTQLTNPKRISLRLRKPGKFGDEVVFIPPKEFRFDFFARNKIAEKLIVLVDRARQSEQTR